MLQQLQNNFKVGKPGEIRRRKAIGPVKWQPVASYRVVSDCQACIGLAVFVFTGGDNHDLYYIKHPIDEDGFPPA